MGAVVAGVLALGGIGALADEAKTNPQTSPASTPVVSTPVVSTRVVSPKATANPTVLKWCEDFRKGIANEKAQYDEFGYTGTDLARAMATDAIYVNHTAPQLPTKIANELSALGASGKYLTGALNRQTSVGVRLGLEDIPKQQNAVLSACSVYKATP